MRSFDGDRSMAAFAYKWVKRNALFVVRFHGHEDKRRRDVDDYRAWMRPAEQLRDHAIYLVNGGSMPSFLSINHGNNTAVSFVGGLTIARRLLIFEMNFLR